MNSIDLTPLYRSSIGFDGLASLLDRAYSSESVTPNYPPYNIEVLSENRYAITLAVAGFEEEELDIHVEKGALTVRGKTQSDEERNFLYQGIANRSFERKFNLADHIEVTGAALNNGLLTVKMVKEIPEAMKPKRIKINGGAEDQDQVIQHEARSLNKDHQAA